MPEFSAGNVLLPQLPPSFEELKARVAALRKANQERQDQIDQFFIDTTKSLTNIDIAEPIAAGRRAETLGGGVVGPEGILIDQLFTSSTGSGADLPPGVDEQGRPRAINQNNQVTAAVGGNEKATEVKMLPMWNADP